ncbi:hypothetical protein KJ891_02175, partial [Candidatus Micrarchaeota archaeon]|nr:hypothetical protein [Candidatus Micrarchaeota archaeon]
MGVKNSFTDLHEISGIALKLENETNKLEFGRGITEVKPDIRHGAEMRQVLQNSDALGAQDCYYMYRGVQREQDNAEIEKAGLRYDITILPAILHGKEFNKTFGHFHPKIQGSELTYTEVYEVLHGKAHYILQGSAVGVESKGKGTQAHAGDFFVVEAGAGDKVVVPPNYGHVTINPSRTEPLVMSNWSAADFKS